MSTVIESRMLRSFLHRLVDGLIDELESVAASIPRAGGGKPRIALDEKAENPKGAKPAPPSAGKTSKRGGRQARGDVLVGCGWRAKRPAVLLRLSETVSERLGLGPGPACDCKVEQVGKTLVVQPGKGLRAWRHPGGRQYLVRLATAHRWGSLERHRSEVCAWHFDLENRLVIQAPAWLPAAGQKAKANPPVSCKKLIGKGEGPVIRCAKCGKAAKVECSRCQKLLCDGCWESHVRLHWHTGKLDKEATAARDARQAMRSEA